MCLAKTPVVLVPPYETLPHARSPRPNPSHFFFLLFTRFLRAVVLLILLLRCFCFPFDVICRRLVLFATFCCRSLSFAVVCCRQTGKFGGGGIPKVGAADAGAGGGDRAGAVQGESADDGSGEEEDALWGKDQEQKLEHHEGQVRVPGVQIFLHVRVCVLLVS